MGMSMSKDNEMSLQERLDAVGKEHSQAVRKLEVFHLNHVGRPAMRRKNIDQETPHHERYGCRGL